MNRILVISVSLESARKALSNDTKIIWTSNTKFILKFLIAHHQKNFSKSDKNGVEVQLRTVKVTFNGCNRKLRRFCIDLPFDFFKSDNFLLSYGWFCLWVFLENFDIFVQKLHFLKFIPPRGEIMVIKFTEYICTLKGIKNLKKSWA